MKKFNGNALAGFLFLIVILFGIVGWFLNLYDLFKHYDTESTRLFILRIVGFFVAPLGALLGWFA